MWVEVAQQKAEHRELGDGVVQAPAIHNGIDYPGRPPPPQVLVGENTPA